MDQTLRHRLIFTLSVPFSLLARLPGTLSLECGHPSGFSLSLGSCESHPVTLLVSHILIGFSFAIAFLLIGFPSLRGPFKPPRQIITKVATWCYATASAAGFLFFGLNFGEEAGSATEVWITRACIVQGAQQIWGEQTDRGQ